MSDKSTATPSLQVMEAERCQNLLQQLATQKANLWAVTDSPVCSSTMRVRP